MRAEPDQQVVIDGGVVEAIARAERAAGVVERGGNVQRKEVFRFAVQRAHFAALQLRDVEIVLHRLVDEVDFGELCLIAQPSRNAEVEHDVRALFQYGARADGGIDLPHAAYAQRDVLPERFSQVDGLAVHGQNIFDLHLVEKRFRFRIECYDCSDHISFSFFAIITTFPVFCNRIVSKSAASSINCAKGGGK